MCFDVVGVDVMLNDSGQPFLLEVNRYPSLKLSLDVDEVKVELVKDMLNILQHGISNSKTKFEENSRFDDDCCEF